jgi:hypothetical protein
LTKLERFNEAGGHSMVENGQPGAPKYEITLSGGPFREPGREILSYDFFINRKGWLIPRVMRVYVDIKAELERFQHQILGVSGGSPGQQLKLMQMLSRMIADQKALIALEEGRIESSSEVLIQGFTGNDAYLFPKLEAWMLDAKDRVRQEITTQVRL